MKLVGSIEQALEIKRTNGTWRPEDLILEDWLFVRAAKGNSAGSRVVGAVPGRTVPVGRRPWLVGAGLLSFVGR